MLSISHCQGTPYQPVQNGKVTAKSIGFTQATYGLRTSTGERACLSWQIGSELIDANTQCNNETGIPAASSVHYWQSVRKTMYPHLGGKSLDRQTDWDEFY